jgi:hypothetical protein
MFDFVDFLLRSKNSKIMLQEVRARLKSFISKPMFKDCNRGSIMFLWIIVSLTSIAEEAAVLLRW